MRGCFTLLKIHCLQNCTPAHTPTCLDMLIYPGLTFMCSAAPVLTGRSLELREVHLLEVPRGPGNAHVWRNHGETHITPSRRGRPSIAPPPTPPGTAARAGLVRNASKLGVLSLYLGVFLNGELNADVCDSVLILANGSTSRPVAPSFIYRQVDA